jgi:hypothetical protein
MSELMPEASALSETFKEIAERAPVGADHSKDEDALAVLQARVRRYSDRLVAAMNFREPGKWTPEELRQLAENAIELGGELVRGLNDCLQTGALSGYAGVSEGRIQAMVEQEGGPITDPGPSMTFQGLEPEIETWIMEVGRHAAEARQSGVAAPIIVREAFATLGAATAMASFLRERADKLETQAEQTD